MKKYKGTYAKLTYSDLLKSLVGMTVCEASHCDTCPLESTDCKKLILIDGSVICVRNNE